MTDLSEGSRVVVRDLNGGGSELERPMVWAEVFAPCEAPSVTVRWTDLEVAPAPGQWRRIGVVRTSYQDYTAGGCTNTNSAALGAGLIQTSNAVRSTAHDAEIRIPVG